MLVLIIVMAILSFSLLSIIGKVAQMRGCNTAAFVGIMNAVGALISVAGIVAAGVAWKPQGLKMVALLGVAGGAAGVIGFASVLAAYRRNGNLAIVSTLVNLSLLIPIVFSVIFMGETLTATRVVGLGLFVVFVALLHDPVRERRA